jgi:methylenetetrahydrofolate dehydrogenase (NADP+)/methenyltetrahydrofolate cyclohydrolase
MQLLDGKKTAEDIKSEIAVEVQKMKDNGEKFPI